MLTAGSIVQLSMPPCSEDVTDTLLGSACRCTGFTVLASAGPLVGLRDRSNEQLYDSTTYPLLVAYLEIDRTREGRKGRGRGGEGRGGEGSN